MKYFLRLTCPTAPLTKTSMTFEISARFNPCLNFISSTIGWRRNHLSTNVITNIHLIYYLVSQVRKTIKKSFKRNQEQKKKKFTKLQ